MAGVGVGGVTPIQGAESVQGGSGGGVGMAAKEKARNVAAGASSSSVGAATEDGN
jgi:hypothetical protein